MVWQRKIIGLLSLVTCAALYPVWSAGAAEIQSQNTGQDAVAAVEDISGTYSFLREGEFVQINLESGRVSGYISRMGDADSDRGVFVDQFFDKASIQGHDVTFTTKPLHGVWFEFKGRYDRGAAKSKAEDGYYLLRGTLKEYSMDADKKTTSRSREVEFKLQRELAEPEPPAADKSKKPKV